MFIIRVISDLHLELRNYIPKDIFPTKLQTSNEAVAVAEAVTEAVAVTVAEAVTEAEEILILAGDIGDPYTELYKNFLGLCRSLFSLVIVISGNHEVMSENVSYKLKDSVDKIKRTIEPENNKYILTEPRDKIYSYNEIVKKINDVCVEKGCVFLNNSSYVYKGVKFIGSILWSNIKKENFPYIKDRGNSIFKWLYLNGDVISMNDYNNLNSKSIKFLEDEIKRGDKCVVITHYPPSIEMLHDAYKHDVMNDMYCNNLKSLFFSNIDLWISGHTHQPKDIIINNVRFVSNAIGDPGDIKKTFGFNKNFSHVIS